MARRSASVNSTGGGEGGKSSSMSGSGSGGGAGGACDTALVDPDDIVSLGEILGSKGLSVNEYGWRVSRTILTRLPLFLSRPSNDHSILLVNDALGWNEGFYA